MKIEDIFTNCYSFNKMININRNYYALNTFEIKKWMVDQMNKVEIHILGGFLGSGKSTLLQKFISSGEEEE